MCTAVIEVPESPDGAVRLLAVRDEDPERAWDPLGHWWPESPDIVGVRDRVAGGAWMAADPALRRLALVLNRAEPAPGHATAAANGLRSRGALVLDEVSGRGLDDPPGTANFNLIAISGSRVALTTWDGASLHTIDLEPGVHMIAHHDLDDVARTARVARWLPEFCALAGLSDEEWWGRWLALLDASTALDAGDDRAIIRDNRGHGYPTLSLIACLAEVRPESQGPGAGLRIDSAVLAQPARWGSREIKTFSA